MRVVVYTFANLALLCAFAVKKREFRGQVQACPRLFFHRAEMFSERFPLVGYHVVKIDFQRGY